MHDIIAVAYEDDFYISEVMNEVSRDEIEISSMARYGTSFRWPKKPDTAITHRNFVLRAIPELVPSKKNTRYSTLEKLRRCCRGVPKVQQEAFLILVTSHITEQNMLFFKTRAFEHAHKKPNMTSRIKCFAIFYV